MACRSVPCSPAGSPARLRRAARRTFGGNPFAGAAALDVLGTIESEDLLDRRPTVGGQLGGALRADGVAAGTRVCAGAAWAAGADPTGRGPGRGGRAGGAAGLRGPAGRDHGWRRALILAHQGGASSTARPPRSATGSPVAASSAARGGTPDMPHHFLRDDDLSPTEQPRCSTGRRRGISPAALAARSARDAPRPRAGHGLREGVDADARQLRDCDVRARRPRAVSADAGIAAGARRADPRHRARADRHWRR